MMTIILVIGAFLQAIWAWGEPLVFILGGLNFLAFNKEQVAKDTFEEVIGPLAYDNLVVHLRTYGLDESVFAPEGKIFHIKQLGKEIKFNGKQYKYRDGVLEKKLLNNFNVPKKNRLDNFLLVSYLRANWKTSLFRLEYKREEFVRFFSKKRTYNHYISLDGWRGRGANDLIEAVESVNKIDKKNYYDHHNYKIVDLMKFANKNKKSSLSSVLNNVLAKGQISSKAVSNLISSEKIIMVYKYAEDFTSVYNKQLAKKRELSDRLAQLKPLTSQRSKNELERRENELKELLENWIQGPLSHSLNELGFQKLFPQDHFVFFLPLSQIDEKYHKNINLFIENVVMTKAKEHIEQHKDNEYLEDFDGKIKYLLLANVVQVGDLLLYEEQRELRNTAPNLHHLMMSRYIDSQPDSISKIYVNDIVSNVDIRDRINRQTQVGRFILDNFEILKAALWREHNIDILRPTQLSSLSSNNVTVIAENLLEGRAGTTKHNLEKKLNELVEFYRRLKQDLEDITKEIKQSNRKK